MILLVVIVVVSLTGCRHATGGRIATLTEKVVELETGTDGTYGSEATYVLFGDWPQTIKASTVTVSFFPRSFNGCMYYLGDDGYYYVKVSAKPFNSKYTFSDGKKIEENTKYYFKVEPIKWRVLTTDYDYDGTSGSNTAKLLLAEKILVNSSYYTSQSDRTINSTTVYPTNYKYSTVRAYLNGLDGSATGGNYSVADFSGAGKNFFYKRILNNCSRPDKDHDSE